MLSLCACRLSILDLAVPWAACRFEPICSEYASASISRYGVLRRCKLATSRLLKCYPFHPGGMGPVK